MSEIVIQPTSPEIQTNQEALKPKTKWIKQWFFEKELNPIQNESSQSRGQPGVSRSNKSKIPIRRKQLKTQIRKIPNKIQSKIPVSKKYLKCVKACGFKTFQFPEFCIHLKNCPQNNHIQN